MVKQVSLKRKAHNLSGTFVKSTSVTNKGTSYNLTHSNHESDNSRNIQNNRSEDTTRNTSLSSDAKTMRTSSSPAERSEAAARLGHAGGQAHGHAAGTQKHNASEGKTSGSNLSSDAKTMRTSTSSAERSEEASHMEHAGRQAHGKTSDHISDNKTAHNRKNERDNQ